jgi:hypothetical protein
VALDGSSFIAGRDLQSLLVRFFMRLNKIDSVVFPDEVKLEITSIKEKHQDAVARIEAESSTKREKSQKLRAHWDSTIEELENALDVDGVAGVETASLNHAAWMVDELLKEMQNVIDVQDLKEPLFALEDKFKTGEDADEIFVMRELQKMARTGDLPYEWVFGGSTGLTDAQQAEKSKHDGRGVIGGVGLPQHHDGSQDDGDMDPEDMSPEEMHRGGPMGAPQHMWWRDYPRQVDNPNWKPPPGMMDNFEFLNNEREETDRRRDEDLKHSERDRKRRKEQRKRDEDRAAEREEQRLEMEKELEEKHEQEDHERHRPHHNLTHHEPPQPRHRPRWGDFNDSDDDQNAKDFLARHPPHHNRTHHEPPQPRHHRRWGDFSDSDDDQNDNDFLKTDEFDMKHSRTGHAKRDFDVASSNDDEMDRHSKRFRQSDDEDDDGELKQRKHQRRAP